MSLGGIADWTVSCCGELPDAASEAMLNPRYYAYAIGVVFLIWLGITLFALLTRLIYDVQSSTVRIARRLIEGRVLATQGDAAAIERALRRLPRRSVERIAADGATEPGLAVAFARHAMTRNESRLQAAASAHTNEVSKWRRVAALRILARSGSDTALPQLGRALADSDADVVNAALATIGEMHDDAAGALLIKALRDGLGPRSRIATQLDEFPLAVGPLLIPLLRDWDPGVRYWAVKLLARYPSLPSLAFELATLGGDEDAAVRGAVAETMGALEGPAATSTAVELLSDEVPFVRAHAARAIGAQGSLELAPLVATLLADEDWWARSAAKQALELLGTAATPYVVPHLESADAFARNGAAEVLQNTGVVDELAREADDHPADARVRDLLRSIIDAGGDGFQSALIARRTPDEPRRRELLDSSTR